MKNKMKKIIASTLTVGTILGTSIFSDVYAQERHRNDRRDRHRDDRSDLEKGLSIFGGILEIFGELEGREEGRDLRRTGRIIRGLSGEHNHYYEPRYMPDCFPHRHDRYRRSRLRPDGRINEAWLEVGVERNGEPGILIHTDFDINHSYGWGSELIAYFHDENGNHLLYDKDDRYTDGKGHVAVSRDVRPRFDHASFYDYQLFIPDSQLDLSKEGVYDLRINLQLLNYSQGHTYKIDQDSRLRLTYEIDYPDDDNDEIKKKGL